MEKRFVCIISGSTFREYPNDVVSIYKTFNTEPEARDFIDKHGQSVVLFNDDELGCRSAEDLRKWYKYKEYESIIESSLEEK